MSIHTKPRAIAVALLTGLSLILSGCFMTPGKFTSELVLTEDDRFTFTYDGEIFFLGLSQLAQMDAATEEFEPEPCYIDATYEVRECSTNEISSQRAQWEAQAETRAAESAREAEQMSAMMGGIDLSDPEASAELVRMLERQEGWHSVVDKGDGVFEVSYSVSGELSHDFMFPVIEGFPMANPFVQIHLRDGDVVRVNAPGFAAQNEASPMAGMMGGMAGMAGLAAMSGEEGNEAMPELPAIEGTFTIRTNGAIRANNTDEGASPSAEGEVLTWQISPRTSAAPTALIDMSR
ncbi:hypothetical protein [uncultured Erythrobacter sp.]|uniref:hypothetical protein n=1 Tax=uncultured Erythrobacter sp. TaxID=263913 RepID=UPI00262BE5C8|nr:hypothetical protein [uncultured Erythrobacter sp.]